MWEVLVVKIYANWNWKFVRNWGALGPAALSVFHKQLYLDHVVSPSPTSSFSILLCQLYLKHLLHYVIDMHRNHHGFLRLTHSTKLLLLQFPQLITF